MIFKVIIQLLPFEVINFIPWSIFLPVKFCFHRGITSVHAYNSLEVFYFHNSRACALCRSRISNLLSEIRWKFSISFHPNCKRGFQFGSYLMVGPDLVDQLLKDIHFFFRSTKVKQISNPVKNCLCCDLLQAAWIYLQKLCRGM